ncbi:hypothetical protein [Ectobacillus polymachus]|uniref:hypothetical protein n=1 Tax=Ectobacillus polymachus TaxID=1508806 RepID=UPI003A85D4C7
MKERIAEFILIKKAIDHTESLIEQSESMAARKAINRAKQHYLQAFAHNLLLSYKKQSLE